ncbi:MAG: serine hydrolase [Cyclobacteriaceae bacterium]|nr:serine hydrolase [Cyclobacteriaceae bacterium]
MRYVFLILLLSIVFSCQSKKEQLKEQIVTTLQSVEGNFAVAFKDLSTGEEILLNERESFHPASTMKTPVMIEVFRQASEGKFSMKDSILVKNEFKSIADSSTYTLTAKDDSEPELYRMIGRKATIQDVVYRMITSSSNLATNILIEKIDARKVTQTMRDLGAKDIQVLRGVEDNAAFKKGLNNSTTAYDLMVIFEKIAEGKAVNEKASKEMIDILLDQKWNDLIPLKLPKGTKVAHKTGWITGVHHDSGIVYLPNGKSYVLILLSKNLKDEEKGKAGLARISEMIYEYEDLTRK